MKLYALLAALCVAGLTASFALGATRDDGGTTSTSTTTTTTGKQRCRPVELGGQASAGSFTLTVSKTSRGARKLANTAVTLTIPAGSRATAIACMDSTGALTLRSLRVLVPRKPRETSTTTTSTTTSTTAKPKKPRGKR